ncbi:MAG: hypothetical protein IVW55_16590 [Chloroflexi bacterium]|nr:hypothetical protein [Chloroflexota bacterium]
MFARRLRVPLALLTAMAVATACGLTQPRTSNTTGVPTTTAPPLPGGYGLVPSDPHLSVRIALKANRIQSGRVIEGTLVVVNRGRTSINLTTRCRPDFAVALTNSKYTPEVGFAAACLLRPYIIAPGINRLPFQLDTTYLGCGPPPGPDPPCLPNAMPPLPVGTYDAVLIGDGILALPQPHPVPVTLTMGPH